jgi:hypothetical protein
MPYTNAIYSPLGFRMVTSKNFRKAATFMSLSSVITDAENDCNRFCVDIANFGN